MSIPSRLTVTHIFSVLKSLGTTRNTPLGRWKVCKNKNDWLIVDYSNVDHCGTCSYVIKENKNIDTNELFDAEYVMMISNTAD
tara:strand:- start:63 stop:311 length:249 start_codon:yes stop_codon:yes gene_type:complete